MFYAQSTSTVESRRRGRGRAKTTTLTTNRMAKSQAKPSTLRTRTLPSRLAAAKFPFRPVLKQRAGVASPFLADVQHQQTVDIRHHSPARPRDEGGGGGGVRWFTVVAGGKSMGDQAGDQETCEV